MKPGPGHRPVPFCRSFGDSPHLGDLLKVESRKETHLYNLALSLVPGRKSLQCLVQRQEIDYLLRNFKCGIQLHSLVSAGALIRVHSPGVIDEHSAHGPRCECKKMRTALPVHLARACELKKCLMYQNSGLERVIRPLMPHVFLSDEVEFLVD